MKPRHFPSRSWAGLGLVAGVAVWMGLVPVAAADETAVTEAMREALYAEEVKGDVAGALKAYEAVTARFEDQRDLAATALFRQGECLRKLERPQEAAAAYRKVLTLFPDKERLVRLSRENLVALGQSEPSGEGTPAVMAVPDDEQKELARVRAMAANSPDLLFAGDSNAFVDAGTNGHLSVLEWFLTEQAEGAKPHLARAARAAVEAGQLKASERLLAAGAPTSGLLVAALQQQRWSVLRLLLEAKADVAEVSESRANVSMPPSGDDMVIHGPVLLIALGMEPPVPSDVLTDLLKAGADPNATGTLRSGQNPATQVTPLTRALQSGDINSLHLLLQAKADPNALVGDPGRTALMRALESTNDQVEVQVDALVGAGADWKVRAPDGWTALHSAAAGGRARRVEATIQAGVDPNAATEDGTTPLMTAQKSILGYHAVPALLTAGAKIQSPHPKLGNSLARACQIWPKEAAGLHALDALLQAGADPQAPATDEGLQLWSPLDGVIRGWDPPWPEAIELLLKHGARPGEMGGDVFRSIQNVLAVRQNRGDKGDDEAWSGILAAFRPLWKARCQRDNDRLMKAVWLDDVEALLESIRQRHVNADDLGKTNQWFSAVFSVDSALDGPPTLRQFLRQLVGVSDVSVRQWDRATITRQVDGQETVISVNLAAIAKGTEEPPALRWGDVVSLPARSQENYPKHGSGNFWALVDPTIALRLDLGSAGVVSNRPAGGVPLWETLLGGVRGAEAPEIALETVVRRAGIPRELLNLGVTIRRVRIDGALEDIQDAASVPRLRHGDIVEFSPPELKPSLSEEAMRDGIWLCQSMEGPFWPVNTKLVRSQYPPLGYLLVALQAPHPGMGQRIDWSKAVLRSFVPRLETIVASGEVRDEGRWNEEPLLTAWPTASLRPGQVLILPAGDEASVEMPPALRDGLSQLAFDWRLQIDNTAPLLQKYRPRFFSRRLEDGRVVWSDAAAEPATGPLLPLVRDLLAMSEAVTDGVPSNVDPLAGVAVDPEWARPDAVVRYNKPKSVPVAPTVPQPEARGRRRTILPPGSDAPK